MIAGQDGEHSLVTEGCMLGPGLLHRQRCKTAAQLGRSSTSTAIGLIDLTIQKLLLPVHQNLQLQRRVGSSALGEIGRVPVAWLISWKTRQADSCPQPANSSSPSQSVRATRASSQHPLVSYFLFLWGSCGRRLSLISVCGATPRLFPPQSLSGLSIISRRTLVMRQGRRTRSTQRVAQDSTNLGVTHSSAPTSHHLTNPTSSTLILTDLHFWACSVC